MTSPVTYRVVVMTCSAVIGCFLAGKSKYALEEDQKEDKKDFREGLHKHEDKPEGDEDAEEGGEEEVSAPPTHKILNKHGFGFCPTLGSRGEEGGGGGRGLFEI